MSANSDRTERTSPLVGVAAALAFAAVGFVFGALALFGSVPLVLRLLLAVGALACLTVGVLGVPGAIGASRVPAGDSRWERTADFTEWWERNRKRRMTFYVVGLVVLGFVFVAGLLAEQSVH